LVKIVAGDTENYEKVVYKAQVLAGYKRMHRERNLKRAATMA